MTRDLDTVCLSNAARDYAGQFLLPTIANPFNRNFAPTGGRGWVLNSMFNFHFKDEFDFIINEIKQHLGPKAQKDFDEAAAKQFTPRSDDEFRKQLADRLAITPNGKRISGKIGLVQIGQVPIGFRYKTQRWVRDAATGKKIKIQAGRTTVHIIKANVHIGESEDEAIARVLKIHQDHGEVIFPLSQLPPTMMALNTRISNEAAIFACDSVVDRLDEGADAAIAAGYTGGQPADVDTAASGTKLFVVVYSDPAFGNAVDVNPNARATASAITSDSSADATGTCGYVRCSATNDAATSLDDHLDGEAGTSGADWNFNTTAIVSGATVAVTSHTVTMPES